MVLGKKDDSIAHSWRDLEKKYWLKRKIEKKKNQHNGLSKTNHTEYAQIYPLRSTYIYW